MFPTYSPFMYSKTAPDNREQRTPVKEVQLTPNWDVILIIPHDEKPNTLRCMASTEILISQMSYFRALFKSGFQESIILQSCRKPRILLKGDDPDAMEIILSILHGKIEAKYADLSPAEIISIARHYDKYCCDGIMGFWVQKWLRKLFSCAKEEEIRSCLTAACMFRCPALVEEFFVKTIVHTSCDMEKELEEYGITIPCDIERVIHRKVVRIISEIKFMMRLTEGQFTLDSRATEYLLILEKHDIWPFKPIRMISEIQARLKEAIDDCDGNHSPYTSPLEILQDKIAKIVLEELSDDTTVLELRRTLTIRRMIEYREKSIEQRLASAQGDEQT